MAGLGEACLHLAAVHIVLDANSQAKKVYPALQFALSSASVKNVDCSVFSQLSALYLHTTKSP